jgi:sialate O-acetylesterase
VNLTLNSNAPLSTTATSSGLWRIALPPQQTSTAPSTLTASSSADGAPVSLSDILFGQVYLCSGQSNMQLSVQMANNSAAEIQDANNYPLLRVYITGYANPSLPAVDVGSPAGPWAPASNVSVGGSGFGGFSAVCYFFGRDLFNQLGGTTPVGLIESSVGGTSIRCWSPKDALAKCNGIPTQLWESYGTGPYELAVLFNGMVAPFATGPTALAGVVWYQAESDNFPQTPFGYYTCMTTRQINAWRAWLNQPALPWLLVEVCTCTADFYANLRQEQSAATALPYVYSVPSFDHGDATSPYGNVHSRFKQPVGARLASVAMRNIYNQPLPSSAPYASYPPPSYSDTLSIVSQGQQLTVTVELNAPSPIVVASNLSCPVSDGVDPHFCGSFLIQTNDTAWQNASLASVTNFIENNTAIVTITAQLPPASPPLYAVGSLYAYFSWPQAVLVTQDGWPVMAWNQSLVMNPPF